MIDLLFVLLFLTFPFMLIKPMQVAGISFLRFSIPSFVLLAIFVFAYLGVLPLYFGWDEYRFNVGVQDKVIVLKVFLLTSWTMFAMTLGFAFSRCFLPLNLFQIKKEKQRALSTIELLLIFFLMLLCLGVFGIYVNNVPSIALFTLLDGGSVADASLSRSLMGNDFSGKYHWYSLFMHHLLLMVSLALFAHWLIKRSFSGMLLFCIAFVCASFASVMATEKAPFAWLLIAHFIVFVCVKKEGKYPVKSLLMFMVALFGSLMIFYIYFMGSENMLAAFSGVMSRSITGSVMPAYFYLEMFPSAQDFLLGRSFPNPGAILPFEGYRLTVEVMNYVFPETLESGLVGSMPTIFWAEMYANFGVWGAAISPFFVGVGLFIISSWVHKLENTPLTVALIVWLALHYKGLAITGLSGYIIDLYFLVVLGSVVSIIFLANKGRLKYA